VTFGTVAYMSPEQSEGLPLDARTDLFSFGAVLYEMATGRRAFGGPTFASIVNAILNRTPPPACEVNRALPPRLGDIIGKTLEKDANLRYQTAADLRADPMRVKKDLESGRGSGALPRAEAEAMAPEHTLLRAAFARVVGPDPRRWWELNHLGMIAGGAIPLYVAWKVKDWIPGRAGLSWFFTVTAFLAVLVTLRLYLRAGDRPRSSVRARARRPGRVVRRAAGDVDRRPGAPRGHAKSHRGGDARAADR